MSCEKDSLLHCSPSSNCAISQHEWGTITHENTLDVPLSEIDPFPNHPFRVQDDDDMAKLVESVANFGVLSPVVLRIKEDGRYELVSGHRRKRAAELAGIVSLPAVVFRMTRDEAVVAMVDANMHRERILPSEKAASYKMKMDALRRQAGRPRSENGAPVEHHLRGTKTRDIVARASGESKEQIRRYVRLTKLIPELLSLVDKGQMGMRPAVEISYLSKEEQHALFEAMEIEIRTPSHSQAIRLRNLSREGRLSKDKIFSIMSEDKPNQAEQLKIPMRKIARFFKPGTSHQSMEACIIKGLELLKHQECSRKR